ncbi:Uncharacterised protein [Leclercia adecarboxylata]|uniref:Uncharacterized protein n=1 Tax=Leclercia adecarboxylata TaxID=83655 RepID=A0A4U9ISQ6_9ENTR|nr:Uncharacterised protein [Leclercia adecarboxylata]
MLPPLINPCSPLADTQYAGNILCLGGFFTQKELHVLPPASAFFTRRNSADIIHQLRDAGSSQTLC